MTNSNRDVEVAQQFSICIESLTWLWLPRKAMPLAFPRGTDTGFAVALTVLR